MSLFPYSRLILYMFRAFISPSSGASQAFVYTTIWFMRVFVIICVRLRTGLWYHKPVRRHTQTINKHYMNQMVAYKQQLEILLMMGL
jgi:hypothetical protein